MTRGRRAGARGGSINAPPHESTNMQAQNSPSFDLDAVDTVTGAEAGANMTVLRLDRTPLIASNGQPVTIRLLGADSTKYRGLARAQVRRRMAELANKPEAMTDDEFEKSNAETLSMLVSCTVSWSNVMDRAGQPIPLTPETASALYTAYPVIREQAESFINDRRNFLPASSKS